MEERGVPFVRERDIAVYYKGRALECAYRADFVCYEQIMVEIKAMDGLTGREYGQLLNYLKATGLKRGLLLNFGASRLEYKRLVC
jgi:GxxExxY protein